MRFHNDQMFKMPMAFTYKVEVSRERWAVKPIMIDGVEYVDFTPTFLNGHTLTKAFNSNYFLPFGTAWRGSNKYCFHMSDTGKTTVCMVRDLKSIQTVIKHPSLKRDLILDNREIYSPVRIDQVNSVINPWLNNTITGDPTAVLNYGNYMNTNSQTVGKLRSDIFKMCRSSEPKWAQSRLKEWPYYPEDSFKIEAKTVNVLRSNDMVCRLELIYNKTEVGCQTIDLSKKPPEVLRGFNAEAKPLDFYLDD